MPKGPQRWKCPVDVIGNAVHVMRIATGEIQEAATGRKVTKAATGLAQTLWDVADIVKLVKAIENQEAVKL